MTILSHELIAAVARASGPSDSASRRILLRTTERSRFNRDLGIPTALPDFGGTPKSTRGTRVLP
jgi:hypothetical protein